MGRRITPDATRTVINCVACPHEGCRLRKTRKVMKTRFQFTSRMVRTLWARMNGLPSQLVALHCIRPHIASFSLSPHTPVLFSSFGFRLSDSAHSLEDRSCYKGILTRCIQTLNGPIHSCREKQISISILSLCGRQVTSRIQAVSRDLETYLGHKANIARRIQQSIILYSISKIGLEPFGRLSS